MPSTTRTGGELPDLHELRRVLGRRHRDVEHVAHDVGHAIERFRSRSTEFVPHLPAHEARGRALADRLEDVGRRVERTRDALDAADNWVGQGVMDQAMAAESARQAASMAWQLTPGSWARAQHWALDIENGGQRWTPAQVRARAGRGGMNTRRAKAVRDQWNQTERVLRGRYDDAWEDALRDAQRVGWRGQLADSVEDVRRLAGRGEGPAMRFGASVGDDAGRLTRTWSAVSNSRIGAVGRLAGRGVGVVGVVSGGVAAWNGHREGDTEQFVTGGLAAVAGAAMFVPCPPVQAAAAVVSVGLLVYDYRDEIAGAGRAVAAAVQRDIARKVEVAQDVVGAVDDAADAVVDAAGDIADAAWNAVKELF